MSYSLAISPARVMWAIKAGTDWEDVEDVLLKPGGKERVSTRLEA